jgi:hypothetical protein
VKELFVKNIVICLFFVSLSFSANANDGTCSAMKKSDKCCFSQYDGIERNRCESCRERKSCFIALDGIERSLCEAYLENKSCFSALNGTDRGWCEVLKERKSCFFALNGEDRKRCEKGEFPQSHIFWAK